ncbi:hypothetical protein N7508_000065 [Penicillium antarcticum]|nr:uncharacterized protein N7508_000065 [Penicillium antarcticum]KAJ5319782.1 hypothetical protein N7508_000065 [Penicillium antarcticum]
MKFLLFVLPLTNAQYGSNDTSMTTTASTTTTGSASSSTHKVDVGKNGFTFDPETLTVAAGEKVEFHFYPQNHSMTQASFDNPCHPISASSFSSGFMPTTKASETVFTLTINDTTPLWFYCGQIGHCQAGMVGVINPPSNGQDTLDSFKKAANTAVGSTIPASVQGGILEKSGAETLSSNSSSATVSASATTSEPASGTTSSTVSPTSAANSVGIAFDMCILVILASFAALCMM